MPTKSEIESRVSRIIQIFKSAMPDIPASYPSITVATQRTYRDTRALLVSQTGSAAVAAPTDEWVVELISGEKGSAILVQKEQVKSLDHLYHVLWSILGRFYIIAAQNDTPSDAKNTLPENESAKQFWSVFASEAIANRVERYLRRTSRNEPAKVEWTDQEIKLIEDEVKIQLMRSYGKQEIEAAELGMLLATLITDDLLFEMISTRQKEMVTLPGEMQPDKELVTLPGEMQPVYKALKALLEQQMEKDRFWETDEITINQISSLLAELNREYQFLIAGELVEDEMAAAELPKGELPDLMEDLPEID